MPPPSLFASGAALAGTVTVITSFPKELTAAYKAAFEKANPDIKVEILNKNTVAGIAFVRETAAGQRPDVFWASAPDAFEVLKRDSLLQAASDVDNKAIPAKIGNYPINDPKGFYKGQALAGYGIMYNTRYLKANKLAAPKEWDDLLKREWFGHVAMTSPSRSGTMHLTVETILQGEGWDAGWSKILQMAGNSAQVTERSFGVPDGINNGQFGAGPVIDFFGLAGKYSGFPVDFVYPAMTSIVPANIALIAGGEEHPRSEEVRPVHAEPAGPGTAARPEDLAPARAGLRELRQQDPGRLPGSAGDREARQGELQRRPVGGPLRARALAVRPDHHVPPEGTAGGHEGDPRSGGEAGRQAERAGRRPAEAGALARLHAHRLVVAGRARRTS